MLRWALRRFSLTYVLYQEAEHSLTLFGKPSLMQRMKHSSYFLGLLRHNEWHQSSSLKSFEDTPGLITKTSSEPELDSFGIFLSS